MIDCVPTACIVNPAPEGTLALSTVWRSSEGRDLNLPEFGGARR